MASKCILVNTGLTDAMSEDVLNSVIGQLSDGMWENSRVMEHYWPFVNIKNVDGYDIQLMDKIRDLSVVGGIYE